MAELPGGGGDATGVLTDVHRTASVDALADAALLERFGAVHVLCNNAGIGAAVGRRCGRRRPNDWRWAFGVNVCGVVHGIKAFVPRMIASGEEGRRQHVVGRRRRSRRCRRRRCTRRRRRR